MNKLKKALLWLYMFNKRLYKRIGFCILLVGILLLAVGFALFSKNASSLMRVAVYCQDEQIISLLQNAQEDADLLSYTFYATEQEAIEAVSRRGFDAAWVFEKDFETAVQQYAENDDPLVRVIQRDDSVFLRLTREKLFTLLYPALSRGVYMDFMQHKAGVTDTAVLETFYENARSEGEIVNILYDDTPAALSTTSLLTGPLRGLLSIAVFLCAWSALMTFEQDRRQGLFARIPFERLWLVRLGCVFLATANAGLVMLVSIGISGQWLGWVTEILLMLLLIASCTALCTLIGECCRRLTVLGAALPVVILASLVLCPIFISLRLCPPLQFILPPYAYLTAFRDVTAWWWGIAYTAAWLLICAILQPIKNHHRPQKVAV